MLASNDRFLTTHAGSLPRSAELVALQVAASRGEAIDGQALREAISVSTRAVIDGQLRAGIDIGNNGEQARESSSLMSISVCPGSGAPACARLSPTWSAIQPGCG